MIIVFSGVDGSGKTTLARRLTQKLKQKGYKVKLVYLGHYFVLSLLVRILHLLYQSLKGDRGKLKEEANPFLVLEDKPLFLKSWMLLVIIDNFLNYLRLKFWSLAGYYVICDRYFYDKLVGLEYFGYSNRFFSWLYLRLTPRPSSCFILDTTPKIAQKRETGRKHSLDFYFHLNKRYREIGKEHSLPLVKTNKKSLKEMEGFVSNLR